MVRNRSRAQLIEQLDGACPRGPWGDASKRAPLACWRAESVAIDRHASDNLKLRKDGRRCQVRSATVGSAIEVSSQIVTFSDVALTEPGSVIEARSRQSKAIGSDRDRRMPADERIIQSVERVSISARLGCRLCSPERDESTTSSLAHRLILHSLRSASCVIQSSANFRNTCEFDAYNPSSSAIAPDLSPYGIRALSKFHERHPYVFHAGGQEHRVDYLPAESDTGIFGGNSNWRGPIWMPVNVMLIRALLNFYTYCG